MPTTKKRVNITPPQKTYFILQKTAEQDGVSLSQKALEMIEFAIEMQEDLYFSQLADQLFEENKDKKWYSHEEAWA